MEGWISIHRKITENPMYFSESFTRMQAWIDMLIITNHTEGYFYVRGNKVIVNRGQIGFGSTKLAERWRWSRGKVTRFLNELEKEGQIVQQKNNVTSLISIVNYDSYQVDSATDRTAGRTADDTTDGQQTEQQTDINNNDNKNNNDNNSLQSKDCPENNDKKVLAKGKKKTSSKEKKTEDEVDKDADLNKKAREAFESRYFLLFKEKYYWQGKDAGNMTRVLNALKQQRVQKGLSNENNVEVVAALTSFLIEAVKDEWIVKNFSISVLFSKFNEIVARAKAKEQERKKEKNYGAK